MKYLDIKQVMKEYPFTKGQLRDWLIRREENGLSKAVRKIGKRLYFNTQFFEEWIEEHKERE